MASREDNIVAESLTEFAQLQVPRALFASQWNEAAELIAPNYRNTFYYGTYNTPGEKKTQRQVDSTGMLALQRFGAILDSMLTPQNGMWHQLRASDEDLMKSKAVSLWFEKVNKLLFRYRYDPVANFSSQNQAVFQSLGAFGNGILYIDEYAGHSGQKGLRYRHVPLGEMFFRENFQGQVDGYCRWFRMTKNQAIQAAAKRGWELPKAIMEARNGETQFEFLQRVCPNDDYKQGHPGQPGKLYHSYYIALTGSKFLGEGGYTSFPCAITRYTQTNGIETYGRGPAQDVLPTLKSINAMKTDYLTQSEMAANPVYLTVDDGIVDWSRRAGALNKGGLAQDGSPLVRPLEHGDINVAIEQMQEESKIVDQAFMVDMFKWLFDDPKIYTATQIVEMAAQRGILTAPVIGRQQSEYLNPTVHRELDLLSMQGLLPPMPPVLKEAGGDYKILYTNPLARSMRSGELAGLNRTLELALQVAQATSDPSPLFYFDWDAVIPEAADINAVPAHWIASPDQVAAKKQAQQKAQEAQQQIQAAPAAAAMAKAEAAQHKAGMKPQQQQPGAPGGV